ncbi:MAG: hypothetical protein AAF869_00835 [Pseudomonadota bacterium]
MFRRDRLAGRSRGFTAAALRDAIGAGAAYGPQKGWGTKPMPANRGQKQRLPPLEAPAPSAAALSGRSAAPRGLDAAALIPLEGFREAVAGSHKASAPDPASLSGEAGGEQGDSLTLAADALRSAAVFGPMSRSAAPSKPKDAWAGDPQAAWGPPPTAPAVGYAATARRDLEREQQRRAQQLRKLMDEAVSAARSYSEIATVSRAAFFLVVASVFGAASVAFVNNAVNGPLAMSEVAGFGLVSALAFGLLAIGFEWFSPNCSSNRRKDFERSVTSVADFISRERDSLVDALNSEKRRRAGPRGPGAPTSHADLIWFEYQDFFRRARAAQLGLAKHAAASVGGKGSAGPRAVVGFALGYLAANLFGGKAAASQGVSLALVMGGLAAAGVALAGGLFVQMKSARFDRADSRFMAQTGLITLPDPEDLDEGLS